MRALPLTLLLLAACASAQVEQDPPDRVEDRNALRQAAFAAAQRGEAAAAAEAFLALARLEPDDPQWVVQAADHLGKAGRFNDAMDLLEETRKRFPDVLSLPAMLARTFHLKADTMVAEGVRDANVVFYYQDAARTAERVLAVDPRHLDARLILASAQYQLGAYDEALAAAEVAVEQHPDEYGGHAMVGRIRFQRFVEARQQLGADGLGAEQRQELTDSAAAHQERARTALLAAAKADRSRSFPRVKLGDLAAWAGDLDEALRWYGEAMAIDPNAQIDHAWLRTAVEAGRRREFYRAVQSAYGARDGATERGRGTIVWYEGQAAFDAAANLAAEVPPAERSAGWKEAARLFAIARQAVPDYADTAWWLMQAEYWAGDLAAATATAVDFARQDARRFADMIRQDEQTVAALVGMAAKAFEQGRLADSRDLNQVVAYARQTADAWNNYAFLCRETRRYEESLRAYEEALRIEPESPQLLNDAGVILQYHTRGEDALARARDHYRRAIEFAERDLAAGRLEGEALQRTRIALRDAKANLARLR
jgi:tetratricopeptide (TPR) repeat protein